MAVTAGEIGIDALKQARDQVIQSSVEDEDSQKNSLLLDAQAKVVEIRGRRQKFELRGTWSTWVIIWISALLLFNMILTGLLASGVWSFADYKWFGIAVTAEMFLQIVGLGYVAMKFLFNDG